jgi:hypothetical protein
VLSVRQGENCRGCGEGGRWWGRSNPMHNVRLFKIATKNPPCTTNILILKKSKKDYTYNTTNQKPYQEMQSK